jgi:Fe-S cluster assembly iron-binding protein IscA
MGTGGWEMLGISREAIKMLKDKLVNGCSEAGIGFRLIVAQDERGEKTFSIKVDTEREGDEVLEADGVKLFIDTANTTWSAGHELAYNEQDQVGFVLR